MIRGFVLILYDTNSIHECSIRHSKLLLPQINNNVSNLKKDIITQSAYDVLNKARIDAEEHRNPFITPEHVLYSMGANPDFHRVLGIIGLPCSFFSDRLIYYLDCLYSVKLGSSYSLQLSKALCFVLDEAIITACQGRDSAVDLPHILFGISCLNDSVAGYLIRKHPEIIDAFKKS